MTDEQTRDDVATSERRAAMGIRPYDLPIPPQIDWAKVDKEARNWMREIAARAGGVVTRG